MFFLFFKLKSGTAKAVPAVAVPTALENKVWFIESGWGTHLKMGYGKCCPYDPFSCPFEAVSVLGPHFTIFFLIFSSFTINLVKFLLQKSFQLAKNQFFKTPNQAFIFKESIRAVTRLRSP